MSDANISAFEAETATAFFDDGSTLPITNWLCGDHDLPSYHGADRAVCGPDLDGNWYAFCFAQLEGGNA